VALTVEGLLVSSRETCFIVQSNKSFVHEWFI
jgi:hypothetical protein